jgi:hypothetical protein
LLQDEKPGQVHLSFVPANRQRINEGTIEIKQLDPTAPNARGTRLAPKPVAKVTRC